jgi:hypothetical protein
VQIQNPKSQIENPNDQSGESLREYNRTTWTQSYVNFMGRHLAIYTNGQTGPTYFPHVNALDARGAPLPKSSAREVSSPLVAL